MPGYCVPTISNGTYSFDKGRIWLNQTDGVRKLAADNFGDISSIAISSDRWRLYVADKNKRFVYVMSIQLDGSLTECYAHGHLHLADDCITLGAAAICVDTEDRVYAATQLGIQTISWTGQNNTILALPGHLPVTGLAFGRVDRKVLYAESNVKVFKRKVNTSGLTETTPLITPESPSF
jgi:sugar lactone lactonase YvrE